MAWPQCNTTLEDERITEEPIWHGQTFHHLGLWLSVIFALIAMLTSFFLIFMHAIHYSRPYEQRHIIRILFMVPVYAVVSFFSFLYYNHSVYFEVIRDCYEAFAIASFFSLMCAYTAPDLHHQKHYFRSISPKSWLWPVPWFQKCCGGDRGIWRIPRSGLTWFNIIWVAIFQYCFIRVTMTMTAVVTQAFDRYCIESLSPAFAHIWVMVIEAIAVTIAMYCLIQFYYQIKEDIAEHQPLLKVLAIKLVIFLSFWQTILISFLTSSGAIKPSKTIQTPDIKIGIPAMLLCIEMALFAIFHFWSFSYRPYKLSSKSVILGDIPGQTPTRYQGGFLGIKAFIDSMNPWDFIKAIGRSAKWIFKGRKHRHQDASYDIALGRKPSEEPSPTKPSVSGPTAYAGASRPTRGGGAEDTETLLANSQSLGVSKSRYDPSPDRSDYGYDHNEVDLGTGTGRLPAYQPYQPARPMPEQEIGVARPYEPPVYNSASYAQETPYQAQPPYQPQPPYQAQHYRRPGGPPPGKENMF